MKIPRAKITDWESAVAAVPKDTYYCLVHHGSYHALKGSRGYNKCPVCGSVSAASEVVHLPADQSYVKIIRNGRLISVHRTLLDDLDYPDLLIETPTTLLEAQGLERRWRKDSNGCPDGYWASRCH